ncbi:MAG: hypothetical protein IPF53_15815 [Blastocatellia bacterium]|nr:hypothetical protein [Blastocatellia bacterium]
MSVIVEVTGNEQLWSIRRVGKLTAGRNGPYTLAPAACARALPERVPMDGVDVPEKEHQPTTGGIREIPRRYRARRPFVEVVRAHRK